MLKLLHLTDLHLVTPGSLLYGLDPQARLQAALADIAAHHGDAAFLLVTGDLAHDGAPAAYASLRAALDGLRLPCHLLLGNHDDRAAFRAAFPAAPVDGDGFVQQVVETRAGAFVLLDTNQPGTDAGLLCERRLAWLASTLAGLRGRPVFLALHHPPLDLGLPAMDAIGLAGRERLAELVRAHGRVRHLFFGHVHRPVHGMWHGVPFSTQRGLNHQVALSLVPPAGFPGNHEPPAYAIALVEEDGVVVHVHDFLDASPRFDLNDAAAARGAVPTPAGA